MARLAIQNLTKKFVKNAAVDRVSLEIPDGAFVGILGPSGCGKTTLLRLIAGLERPTQGDILIGDRNIKVYPEFPTGYTAKITDCFLIYYLQPCML
jgi:ABC-type Fe3+/spermidine/putrescine transport system ATPase subunit